MKDLRKGEKCSLPTGKKLEGSRVGIGLGWDHIEGQASQFDLDISAFLLNENGFLLSDAFFIYYGNPKSPNQEVIHSGDNRSGVGTGDDEYLWVDLAEVEATVTDILFVVSIHEGQFKHQHFGMLKNAYIRAFREDTGEELLRYNLQDELCFFDTGEFARISRKKEKWVFHASGQGEHGGLESLIKMYSARL